MRILLIEDEPVLGEAVATHLKRSGHAVDWVQRLDDAEAALRGVEYGLILLDLHLPDGRGLDLLRALRKSGDKRPVIILTARDQIRDRIEGLNAGADDYLVKPFVFAELVARVRALSRRVPSAPPIVRRGDLTVDRARHRATRGSRLLSLTRKEFGILETLLAADGALVSAEELLERVWDADVDPFSNIVSVTMARLRRKLGEPPLIDTVVGKGYRM
jgi:DNA-binding response OmpR family regulator